MRLRGCIIYAEAPSAGRGITRQHGMYTLRLPPTSASLINTVLCKAGLLCNTYVHSNTKLSEFHPIQSASRIARPLSPIKQMFKQGLSGFSRGSGQTTQSPRCSAQAKRMSLLRNGNAVDRESTRTLFVAELASSCSLKSRVS